MKNVPDRVAAPQPRRGNRHPHHARRAPLAFALIAGGTVALSISWAGAQDGAKVGAGETVYNTYCSTCHGDDLISSGQTFDLRRLKASDRSRFEAAVMMGKGQMPPWKDVLTSDQVDALWHYIRANAHEK